MKPTGSKDKLTAYFQGKYSKRDTYYVCYFVLLLPKDMLYGSLSEYW